MPYVIKHKTKAFQASHYYYAKLLAQNPHSRPLAPRARKRPRKLQLLLARLRQVHILQLKHCSLQRASKSHKSILLLVLRKGVSTLSPERENLTNTWKVGDTYDALDAKESSDRRGF